jgi:fructokinase
MAEPAAGAAAAAAAGPVIAVAGEALIDLVPAGPDGLFRAAPGGSPANVAVGLARLGVPTRLLARLAGDPFGRRLREHLDRNGVDLTHTVAAPEPSSLAIVTVAADGTVAYDFRVDGTADWQWTDAELRDAVDGAVGALHVGSLALVVEPGAAALRRLVARARATATISFDPNVRPLLMGSRADVLAGVEEQLGVSDVVKASAEDVAWLLPGEPLEDVAARWAARGPAMVVITLGPDGALAASGAGLRRRPPVPVTVVDTVGAGDSFTSALLAALGRRGLLGAAHRGALQEITADELAAVVDEAVLASAITCSRPGADPPTFAELAGGIR